MAVEVRRDTRAPAAATGSADPPRRLVQSPIRPRTFHAGDALLLGGVAASAFCLVWLVYSQLLPVSGWPGFVVLWYAAFLAMYWFAVRELRGRLVATDAVATVVITTAAVAMLVPLVMIVVFVVYKGIRVLRPHFFIETVATCGGLDPATCGGVGHAIVGTLEQVGLAMVLSVPLAVLCAVFINEIGGSLRRPVQIVVDAMSGVPSIVAGLFIFAVWVVGLQRGFSGFAASLALAILMLPTVTRTSVEVLRLVPDGLREASLALGGSEWRTVTRVVLPTARSGLITAVILGVARAVGETAPLIVTAFGSSLFNGNPFSNPQESLPHFAYEYVRNSNPGTGPSERGWADALVLIVLVLALFTLARVIGARTSIESRQRRALKRERRRTPVAVAADASSTGGARR